ncbi:hypothetical protein A3E39_01950 [Candidatus Uhrbacteria bacterium RIFCSPHIGHO2_12_FULL_60_25]|uniref:Uncharacterized protein n=1 Tax=Candidatus Uhrbacteria bacterium RIFCSPHIGHO2_12_FULL_60_25 TaxID=1802399 RepID=A0A1F7UKV7_9BACT|nr:MAG: hypothetical protein A3D73_03970 [Candidatus Uhrbacteria bacterium RIFCSPHIGHO2_02_FULL_60_44]OGL78930.1 MAG: hypothetical protein A3E39_01950 [Candidatus Uhrbacteria bacterium RIFCSPHIGHO2_12_FULL_60_25]
MIMHMTDQNKHRTPKDITSDARTLQKKFLEIQHKSVQLMGKVDAKQAERTIQTLRKRLVE